MRRAEIGLSADGRSGLAVSDPGSAVDVTATTVDPTQARHSDTRAVLLFEFDHQGSTRRFSRRRVLEC
jgi:hypothetical protein